MPKAPALQRHLGRTIAAYPPAWPNRDAAPGDPAFSGLIYRGIIWWGALLVRTYHRVEIVGEAFPEDRPVLVVQNHTNGLCDAHVLMCTTPRPLRILVKYKLITAPAIGWMLRRMRAVPVYRRKDGVDTRKNAQSFEAIDEALRESSVVALFPEGESLNSIGLRPLKTGVARMATSAEASVPGGLGVQVVPIGVTYEDRDRLRCIASTVIGPPIDAADHLGAVGGEGSRDAIQSLLDAVSEGIKKLILHADSQEEYDTAVALERLLPQGEAPIGIRRQRALASLRADASAQASERANAIRALGERFSAARLTGDDVLAPSASASAAYAPCLTALPLLIFALPFWLPIAGLGVFISKFPKTPDKKVTLRVLFGYLALVLTIPVWASVFAWLASGTSVSPWVGAGVGLGAYWLAAQVFVPSLDRWIHGRVLRARRALDANPGELASLEASLRSIREAYAQR